MTTIEVELGFKSPVTGVPARIVIFTMKILPKFTYISNGMSKKPRGTHA